MKSKKEIEERIGFKLEYREYETYINGNDYNNFQDEVVKHRTLDPKSADAVKKLLIESLETGDIETSYVCEGILREAEIGENELDSDFKGKRDELQAQFIDSYIAELQSIDLDSIDTSKVEEILENYQMISRFQNAQSLADKNKELSEVIQSKIESRIQDLDGQIAKLKQHIEIPENEEKLNELQQKIEDIEETYVDFRARTTASHSRNMETIKNRLQNEGFNHKAKRIAEQGIDTSEIMQDISQYRAVNLEGRNSSDYYVREFNELNGKVAKKTEYLEQKLAFLQEHKEIPGNAERILQVEAELETIQDSWVVAQQGYNNIDGIIQTATSRITDIQKRIDQTKKELETMTPMSRNYLQKRDQIESLTKEIQKYEKYIEKIQQTGQEIADGTNPKFMGKHHRDRLQMEEQERIEANRGKIQGLEEQIAELQEHIEIPENEEKIIKLQAQIDEIEATIPSDRGNHKRARLEEQGRNTEAIMTDIDDIIDRFNDPYVQGKAESIDKEIKTRVAYLENKKKAIEQHLDITGNEERVADLQSEIEQLEDRWELCAQGFSSKEQIEQRIRVTKAHLHTTLMSFKANKELKLTTEQMQEFWDRIQNGEKIPELFGQHHKERLEKEKNARTRAEQQEKAELEQEYGLAGIEDREALQRKLEDIVSKGIFLGADKNSEKKVAEYEKLKKVIPRFEELKDVYLKLRVAGIEDELYEGIDFQNVSFNDLLDRATVILEEKAREDEKKTELEQPETIIDEQPEVIKPKKVAKKSMEDEPSILAETIENTIETTINIDSANTMEAHLEYMKSQQEQQTSQVVEDYWNEIHSQQTKTYEQQQPERIRPKEKSIKDEVGDEIKKEEQQIQEMDNPTMDLWMNRFSSWYSAIDRVSQNVKAKFVKMKSDIIKAISDKIKERTNKQEINKNQDQNER